MSRAAIAKEIIVSQTRDLRMPGAARVYEALARQAREENWAYEDFLREVLSAEQVSRRDSATKQRLRDAHFPEMKLLQDFDYAGTDGAINPMQLGEFARCDWIKNGDNLLLVGPIGTGKTHVAIGLGVEAAKQRKRVLFTRTADLVRILIEARDSRELGRMHRRLRNVDLLILDELGFVPFDRTGGELLFNVLADRYEKKSVLVTSNLPFGEWTKVFGGDEKLTAALLDRLAHHATVIATKGKSYRLRSRENGLLQPERANETSESQVTTTEVQRDNAGSRRKGPGARGT